MHEETSNEEESCGNCRFFVRHEYKDLDVISDFGECCRYPPRRMSEETSAFPMVTDDCFCGEWTKSM